MITTLLSLATFLLGLFFSGLVANTSNELSGKQLCLNWTEFVVAEHQAGIPLSRIDLLGENISASSSNLGSKSPITRNCGNAEEIIGLRGR